MNAIHLASVVGKLDWVKYLAPLAGDRICDKDLSNQTCLDWAVSLKQQSVVLYLSSSFPVLRSKVKLCACIRLIHGSECTYCLTTLFMY